MQDKLLNLSTILLKFCFNASFGCKDIDLFLGKFLDTIRYIVIIKVKMQTPIKRKL